MKDIELWNEGDWIAAIAAVALFAVLAFGGMLADGRKSEEVVGHPAACSCCSTPRCGSASPTTECARCSSST